MTGHSNHTNTHSNNSVGHLTQVNEGKSISFIHTICFYCGFGILSVIMSSTRRVGDILFLVRIALAYASAFISVHFLLNQLLDFNQTCIVTLLGGGKEVTLSYFLGHSGKCP